MKAFLTVLAVGLLGLGFAAWRAVADGRDARGGALSDDDRNGAAKAVYAYLKLATHLADAGGDPRFAERIPASREVVEEILADVAFTRHAGRVELPELVRLELRDVAGAGPGRADVRAREYWVTRFERVGGGDAGSPRSDVVDVRYVVAREPGGWRVLDWALDLEAGERGR